MNKLFLISPARTILGSRKRKTHKLLDEKSSCFRVSVSWFWQGEHPLPFFSAFVAYNLFFPLILITFQDPPTCFNFSSKFYILCFDWSDLVCIFQFFSIYQCYLLLSANPSSQTTKTQPNSCFHEEWQEINFIKFSFEFILHWSSAFWFDSYRIHSRVGGQGGMLTPASFDQ